MDAPGARRHPDLGYEELALLLSLGERLVSELDLETVMALVAEAACKMVQAETLAVPIIDADRQTFTYRAAHGDHADALHDQTLPIGEGACGWVLRHQRPLLFGEGENFELNASARWRPGMASSLLVPLVCRGSIIGGLSAMGKRGGGAFTPRDLTVLTLLANQASVAIDNAMLFGRLGAEEARLRLVLYSAAEGIFGVDLEGRCTFANPACTRMLGYVDNADLIGRPILETIFRQPEGADELQRLFFLRDGASVHDEGIFWRRDDAFFAVEYWAHPAVQDGKVIGAVVTFVDIGARKKAENELRESEEIFRNLFSNTTVGMFRSRLDGSETLNANDKFLEIVGRTREEVIGKPSVVLWVDPLRREEMVRRLAAGTRVVDFEFQMYNKKGEVRDCVTSLNLYPESGILEGSILDITERKKADEQIRNLAFHDALTQLPNRRLMLDRLQQALASAARHKRYGAVMLLDMDDFKMLNDTLGHDVGDRLLIEVASRLQTCVREGDTVARQGGDEFVVILEDLSGDSLAAMQAESVATKIQRAITQPFQLELAVPGGTTRIRSHHCTSSIGIALFLEGPLTVDELMKRADTAMYQAKAAGRNTLRFFDPDMQAQVATRAALDNDLREAVRHGQFLLYYQPQVDGSGRLTGAEALLRWQHPERGMVSPADFIPLAEATGLIQAIGHWVLESACARLVEWAARPALRDLTLAVNVSARQFRHPDFVDQMLAILAGSGADPTRLKLELTESLLLDDVDAVIAKMSAIKDMGVGFALDDFGTGYSSLSYLKRLPLDQLKIDRSFVRDVLTDANDAAIARTIVALAQSMGLAVIAEGVETAAQQEFLAANGCHAYQGYFFGRPVPIDAFEQLARQGGTARR